MIKCIILDDEELAIAHLKRLIDIVPELQLVLASTNAREVINFIKKEDIDILFIDINMPDLNGLEVISLVPANIKLIFTTAHAEHAVKCYEKNTIDYLLKPITVERFSICVNKILTQLAQKKVSVSSRIVNDYNESFFVKIGKKIKPITLNEVLYFEARADYISCETLTEKILFHMTMKDLEQKLPTYFCRIHHSYIINLNRILKIEENNIYLSPKDLSLPISGKYKTTLFGLINQRSLN